MYFMAMANLGNEYSKLTNNPTNERDSRGWSRTSPEMNPRKIRLVEIASGRTPDARQHPHREAVAPPGASLPTLPPMTTVRCHMLLPRHLRATHQTQA